MVTTSIKDMLSMGFMPVFLALSFYRNFYAMGTVPCPWAVPMPRDLFCNGSTPSGRPLGNPWFQHPFRKSDVTPMTSRDLWPVHYLWMTRLIIVIRAPGVAQSQKRQKHNNGIFVIEQHNIFVPQQHLSLCHTVVVVTNNLISLNCFRICLLNVLPCCLWDTSEKCSPTEKSTWGDVFALP